MLSVKIQVIVACLVLIALCVIVNMIRKKRLELRYALAWLLVGVGTLVLDCFPKTIGMISEMVGIASPVLTVAVSRMSIRIKQLAQELALYQKDNEK